MINYCYTLKDVLGLISTPMTYDKDKIVTLLRNSFSSDSNELSNVLSLHNIDINHLLREKLDNGNIVINKTPYSQLLNLIKLRYQSDYIIKVCNMFTNPNYDIEELQDWCEKFVDILVATKDKYVTILNIYDSQIEKLMNPLKTTHLGSGNTARHENYDTDVSGKNLFTEAPQTTDVTATIDENQFVSEVSKSQAHTDNVGDVSEARQEASTTEMDSMTAMAKIKEIQDSYQNVLRRWSDEFSYLFMEEV